MILNTSYAFEGWGLVGHLPDRVTGRSIRECVGNGLGMVEAQRISAGKMMMKIILNLLLSGL